MGDVCEEHQGGKVEVFTVADVEQWKPASISMHPAAEKVSVANAVF